MKKLLTILALVSAVTLANDSPLTRTTNSQVERSKISNSDLFKLLYLEPHYEQTSEDTSTPKDTLISEEPKTAFILDGNYPITSRFHQLRSQGGNDKRLHQGIDFGTPTGTPIYAFKSGTVNCAGWNGGYGRLVEIEHDSISSLYAHLSEIEVKLGQKIKAGQEIGLSGNSGNSTGPHLHFEIRDKHGKPINPLKYDIIP